MAMSRGRVALSGIGLWLLATIVASGLAQDKPIVATAPLAGTSLKAPESQVAGLTGCAARGCHGGPIRSDAGPVPAGVKNACSIWLQHDRHYHAYRVLYSELSEKMIRHLAGGKPAPPAYQDSRCLACHTTPTLAEVAATPEVRRLRREGVSCDACHTSPGMATSDWYFPHQRGDRPGGLDDCYEHLGMRWLGDTRSRAAVCVGCHVGAPADPEHGIPRREVNHDLIAAGHPRLNFEYTTYLALMPPHWSDARDEKSRLAASAAPGTEVLDWYLGQLASHSAGLRLLADQASRTEGTWPELAALQCYSCHFNFLKNPRPGEGPTWRQKAASAWKNPHGQAAWSQLSIPRPIRAWLSRNKEWRKHWTELERLMACPRPPANQVAKIARTLAEQIDQMAAQLSQSLHKPTAALELIQELQEQWNSQPLPTWDEVAQIYYALQAVNQSRHRLRSRKSDAPDSIDQQLQHLAEALRLPRKPTVINSPVDYDPEHVSPPMRLLMQSIIAWYRDQGFPESPSR